MPENSEHTSAAPAAVILAAGKGTRMPGDLPKVLFEVGGRPMIMPVIDVCREVGCARIIVVVGYRQDLVRLALESEPVEFVVQEEQLGTGHAVRCAEQPLRDEPAKLPVLVLCGDGPLIRASTLRDLLARHAGERAQATLATAVLDDPTGYGRIVRDDSGRFEAIVEHKNCTPEQLGVREVNPSYYCFSRVPLFETLADVRRNELSGEYYVTDVPGLLRERGSVVGVMDSVPPEDVLSINTPEDLARVDRVYRARHSGVEP
jgi:bifunctional UDP-N-acetylglucosamine pyrophosphorylase/glucosamine-1-phosphate N-acetyltransferase